MIIPIPEILLALSNTLIDDLNTQDQSISVNDLSVPANQNDYLVESDNAVSDFSNDYQLDDNLEEIYIDLNIGSSDDTSGPKGGHSSGSSGGSGGHSSGSSGSSGGHSSGSSGSSGSGSSGSSGSGSGSGTKGGAQGSQNQGYAGRSGGSNGINVNAANGQHVNYLGSGRYSPGIILPAVAIGAAGGFVGAGLIAGHAYHTYTTDGGSLIYSEIPTLCQSGAVETASTGSYSGVTTCVTSVPTYSVGGIMYAQASDIASASYSTVSAISSTSVSASSGSNIVGRSLNGGTANPYIYGTLVTAAIIALI
ncbi:hypothetical protein DAMA08_025800 [Martiniozyma asiatica (nom. inval.)]|nr:hypothetical protein DAMA08_025800 [Martiniozyma asiatica]